LLEIDGQSPLLMDALDDGFHELCCPCPVGARYRYRVNPHTLVPDPASRFQHGDVHDSSVVVDTGSYVWLHPEWRGRPWTEAVFYEIHCGLAGGFSGVRQRLPELAQLGITALELMPVADFPGTRDWGYDGVLPYAPDRAYGAPQELKQLIDAAHGLGMMVFLDVVYNHFGPDGNYLGVYAPEFFRDDVHTPWGPAIDFRRPQVRDFFSENALYWLREYRFDGLRLDAVHAIHDQDWLPEMASFVRAHVASGRYVHLVLENDNNSASLLQRGFDAQWNDDAHHVVHHLLTGETQGYYAAYEDEPAQRLARVLAEGFAYQGQPSITRAGKPRGEPSAMLPPTSFVFFLQNHDQIGNRAFGERLITLCGSDVRGLHAAVALQLLSPQIPLLFMGEEYGAGTPFHYFTSFRDPALAAAVRDGRRAEFATFREFAEPENRARIPDPNDARTWERSRPNVDPTETRARHWRDWYARLLALRRTRIVPHLRGTRSVGVGVIGPCAVRSQWRLGNGALLTIYCNFGEQDCLCPSLAESAGDLLFVSKAGAEETARRGGVPAATTIVTLSRAGFGGLL
jgi:maltooligosyltrehalose trehalohydrolase